MSSKSQRYSKKPCKKSENFQKVYFQRDGCTWTISFPLEMETFSLLSTAHILLYLLNFEFPFIMKEIAPF